MDCESSALMETEDITTAPVPWQAAWEHLNDAPDNAIVFDGSAEAAFHLTTFNPGEHTLFFESVL